MIYIFSVFLTIHIIVFIMENYSEEISNVLKKYTLSLIDLGADISIMKEGFKKATGENLDLNDLNDLHPVTIIPEYNYQIKKAAVIGDFKFHNILKSKLTTNPSFNGKYIPSLDFSDIKTGGFIIGSTKVEPLSRYLERIGIPFEVINYDEFIDLDKKDKFIYFKPLSNNNSNVEGKHYITLKANCKHKTNPSHKKEIKLDFSFDNEHSYSVHKKERFKNFKNTFNEALKKTNHKNMVVCGNIIPSGTPKKNNKAFNVKSSSSSTNKTPHLNKNKWGNLEEPKTGFVFSDFKIRKTRIVIGKQNKSTSPKFKKGILSLKPLTNKDIRICEKNDWTSLNEEHIEILSSSTNPKHKKIYRELKRISPDDEVIIDDVDDEDDFFDDDVNYFEEEVSSDTDSYYDEFDSDDIFNNDDIDTF